MTTALTTASMKGGVSSQDIICHAFRIWSLSLSLNSGTTAIRHDENAQLSLLGYLDFLVLLCCDYAKAGGKTLQLRKLVLGLSIILWAPADYSEGLLKLKF
jgi:hypothetical protein